MPGAMAEGIERKNARTDQQTFLPLRSPVTLVGSLQTSWQQL